MRTEITNKIEKCQTFFQHRRGMSPIVLEVLEVEERLPAMDICKVRWYIMGHDEVFTSVFPMVARDGKLADFVPIPRDIYRQSVSILKELRKSITQQVALSIDDKVRLHRNAKRRILRLINKHLPQS